MGQSNTPIRSGAFVIGPVLVDAAEALVKRIAREINGPAAVEYAVDSVARRFGEYWQAVMPVVAVATPMGDVSLQAQSGGPVRPVFAYDLLVAPDGDKQCFIIVLARDGADPDKLLEKLNRAIKMPDPDPVVTAWGIAPPSGANLFTMWLPDGGKG